jgi:hypothetical protein
MAMDSNVIIGIAAVAAAGVAMMLMQRWLIGLGENCRRRLFENGNRALDSAKVPEHEKQIIEIMLDLSLRPRGGWLVTRSYAKAALRRTDDAPARGRTAIPNVEKLAFDFAMSALSVNLPAAVLASVFVLIEAIRSHVRFKRAARIGSSEVPRVLCSA